MRWWTWGSKASWRNSDKLHDVGNYVTLIIIIIIIIIIIWRVHIGDVTLVIAIRETQTQLWKNPNPGLYQQIPLSAGERLWIFYSNIVADIFIPFVHGLCSWAGWRELNLQANEILSERKG